MKRTTRPIIYVVREIERSGVTLRPSVSIEATASGAITYGVRLSARTLREAREGSEVEFREAAAIRGEDEKRGGGEVSRHTPGPWRTGREDMQSHDGLTGEPFSSIYADDERGEFHLGERLPLTVAIIPGEKITRKEEKANARLIAAAPELLAMVKGLRQYLAGHDTSDIDELIHKAGGDEA